MMMLRLTPLGISILEDIFDGPVNVPEEFEVTPVDPRGIKQGIPEECKFITSTLIQCKLCIQNHFWNALAGHRIQIQQTFDMIITESYNRNNQAEFDIPYVFWSRRHADSNFGFLSDLERRIRRIYADYFILFSFSDFDGERFSGMKPQQYTQYKSVIYEAITELENQLQAEGEHTGLQKLPENPFTPYPQTLAQQIRTVEYQNNLMYPTMMMDTTEK